VTIVKYRDRVYNSDAGDTGTEVLATMVDENEFFRQATIRICGSLDIETALQRSLQYLGDFIPVSKIYLSLYQPAGARSRYLAIVTHDEIKALPDPIPLSLDEMRALESYYDNATDGIAIPNPPESHPAARAMSRLSGEKMNKSHLHMYLPIENKKHGVLVFATEGRNRYTESHVRLLSLLREPFTVALSNFLTHHELLELKDSLDAENRELSKKLNRSSGDEIVGAGQGLRHVMEMIRQVAPLDSPVMLLGETGVGKEILANAIHYSSARRDKPFIKVNCGAIEDGFLDSELFGHEKGSFTGAVGLKRGRFERAHTGSIFLDEIGELSPAAQVKLLRVIQHREIERIGGTASIPVDVRIITATHRNLEEMIRTGHFREDLWFRLNIFPIMIPPLRQRKEDVPALVRHFVATKSRDLKFRNPPPVTAESIEQLRSHYWPGNVRELENIVERALILHTGLKEAVPLSFEHFIFPETKNKRGPGRDGAQEILPLRDAEIAHIEKALILTRGKVHGADGAAHLLRINPNTLRSKMKKLGISSGRRGYSSGEQEE
jgi:transcriptional regulator with GAF, ATPase, and Fis domain